MVEHAPGVTRLLDRLEAKDLVRRRRCPEDRRQVLCWIEPAGERLLAELESPMRAIARRRMAGLGPGGLEALIELMEAVAGGTSRSGRSHTRRNLMNRVFAASLLAAALGRAGVRRHLRDRPGPLRAPRSRSAT